MKASTPIPPLMWFVAAIIVAAMLLLFATRMVGLMEGGLV